MASDLKLFELAAPPGTGVEWVMRECERVGLRPQTATSVLDVFSEEGTDKLRVSLVRHPCRWLSLMFDMIDSGTGVGADFVNFMVMSDGNDFDTFVRNYLKRMPGEIGRMHDRYKCNTRMRIEDMPWALSEFLESVGVPDRLLKLVSDPGRLFVVDSKQWDERLFREVTEAESEMCLNFDYY